MKEFLSLIVTIFEEKARILNEESASIKSILLITYLSFQGTSSDSKWGNHDSGSDFDSLNLANFQG